MPKYKLDERLQVNREYDFPPDSLFMGLGWDPEPDSKQKHYRRYYNCELEKNPEIMTKESPFDQYPLKKGQSRGASKGLWPFSKKKEDDSGSTSTEQVVGKFKGLLVIAAEGEKEVYNEMKNEKVHRLRGKLDRLSYKLHGETFDQKKIDKLDTAEG